MISDGKNGYPPDGYGNGFTEDGKPKILPTSDGHHDRADTRALVSAAVKGQLSGPLDINWAIRVLKRIAEDDRADARARAQAAKGAGDIIQKASELGLRLIEFEDKANRLDDGKPTERVEQFQVTIPEARSRIDV